MSPLESNAAKGSGRPGGPVSPYFLGLLAAVAGGSFLRLKALTFQSLWYDELLAAWAASRGLARAVATYLQWDLNPPLFHVSLWLWQRVLGVSDLSARLLPAVFGVLGIVALYFLGREMFSRSVGLFASLILSVNLYHLRYSQEVRPYSLLFLLSVLSYLCFVRQVRRPSWRNSLWYVVATTLLIYTHYFGLLILASQAVFLAFSLPLDEWKDRSRILKFQLPSFLGVGVLYIPWIPRVVSLLPLDRLWTPKPSPDFFRAYFREYFGPELLVVFVLAVLLLLFALGRRREEEFGPSKLLLLVWVVIMLFLPYLRSFGHPAPLSARYALPVIPALLLAAGRGLEELREKGIKVFLVVILVGLSLVGIFLTRGNYYQIPTKQQWRQTAQYVIQQDPEKRYALAADRLFGYYFNAIYHRGVEVGPDLQTRTERIPAFCRHVRSGKVPGFWLIEKFWSGAENTTPFRACREALVPVASQRFLRLRATLFVGPRDLVLTSRRVEVPLSWLSIEGRGVPAEAQHLNLGPGSSGETPRLAFGRGRYLVSVAAQGPAGLNLDLQAEGEPKSHSFSLTGSGRWFEAVVDVPQASRRRIILDVPAVPGATAPSPVRVERLRIQKLEPLSSLLPESAASLGDRTLVIAAGGEVQPLLVPALVESFGRLRLAKIQELEGASPAASYIAVFREGRLVFERAKNGPVGYKDKLLMVSSGASGPRSCRVVVNHIDYAKSQSGLNFVLVDGENISTFVVRSVRRGEPLVERFR
jgi:hypothetical protein